MFVWAWPGIQSGWKRPLCTAGGLVTGRVTCHWGGKRGSPLLSWPAVCGAIVTGRCNLSLGREAGVAPAQLASSGLVLQVAVMVSWLGGCTYAIRLQLPVPCHTLAAPVSEHVCPMSVQGKTFRRVSVQRRPNHSLVQAFPIVENVALS